MSCGNVDDSGGALSRAIREATAVCIPVNVTLELSTACNLRCAHCYNFDRKKTTRPKTEHPPLNPAEIISLLSDLRAAGAVVVAFTGGEAMLHPHLLDFVRESRRLRLAVRLKTNATLITKEKAAELFEAGVSDLETSVYGASAEVHDKFTRIPGSFEKTIEGIKNARNIGMVVSVSFIMHHEAVAEFDAMVDLADSLGASYAISMELTARYDGTTDSLDLRVTKEDLMKIYSGPRKDLFAGVINKTNSVQCACATTNCGIGFDGTVYPCIGAPIPSGNLHENSFMTIWKESPTFKWIRSLSLKDFKDCDPCGIREYCQRSSGAVFTNTGNYTGKDEWNCMQAELLKDLNEKKTGT